MLCLVIYCLYFYVSTYQKLEEMFPNLDKEVIHSVLEANGGNVESSINGLLSM